MKKFNNIWKRILIIIGSICLISACILVIGQTIQNRQAEEHLAAMRDSAEVTREETSSTTLDTAIYADFDTEPEASSESEMIQMTEGTPETAPEEVATPVSIPNPYAEIFAAYEDIVGWLIVPDTNIDYPVVWTPEDENYYLRRDIDGNADTNGCLILDTDSCVDPLSTNLIIHGHNMNSGAMFGHLADYENEDFYKEHTQITLYTEACQRNYEVIAVFRSEVYKKKDTVFKYYKFFQANTEEEFEDFYQNIKNLSLYDTGVTAEFGDRFITLSTCSYHVERGRFVVVAKEVESGDSYLPIGE